MFSIILQHNFDVGIVRISPPRFLHLGKVEMNIHVGDDNVRVKKSPKKNEKMRGHQEKREKPP